MADPDDQPVTNPIVRLRRARGWTEEQAAELLGIDGETLRAYESGSRPVPEEIARLALVLMNECCG